MNTKHTLKYAEEPGLDDLVVVKKFNEWMLEGRDLPVPKMLFGNLWLEGEIAVMSADHGAGKSLLAVQIAESIARGKSFLSSPPYEGGVAPASGDGVVLSQSHHAGISPDPHTENHPTAEAAPLLRKEGSLFTEDESFACTAEPQNVLYLNLKLSSKQFAVRYAEEDEPEDGATLKNPYKFSKNLHRVDINIHAKLPEGYHSFDEILPPLVERLVAKHKAKVVIIDSITYLQRSVYGYRETYTMMRGLHRIKSQLGISILVLARTSKYGSVRESTAGSCSALFSRFADSVFMIGQSRLDPSARYLKQLIVHSSEKIYNESHVASFRIRRRDGNFLGLEHYGFCPESDHHQPVRDNVLWPTIDRIKTLSKEDKSIREIADELDLPKSSVHRYLQMWTAEIGAAMKEQNRAREPYDPTKSPYYFPGREEYYEAMNDPKFKLLMDTSIPDEDPRYRTLMREYGIIDNASYRASQVYKKTGITPKLAEDKQYAEFMGLGSARSQCGQACLTNGDPSSTTSSSSEAEPPSEGSIGPSSGQASLTALRRGGREDDLNEDTDPITRARIACKSSHAAWRSAAASGEKLPGLKYDLNDHGKEVWIEKSDERRKPVVWYTFNSKGRKQKHVRDSFGVITKTQSGPLIE